MKYSLFNCPATIEGTLNIPAPNIVPMIKAAISKVLKDRFGAVVCSDLFEFVIIK
jgi:hypothetical protein